MLAQKTWDEDTEPRLKGANKFQEQYTLYQIWTESLITGEPFHIEARKWYKILRAQQS